MRKLLKYLSNFIFGCIFAVLIIYIIGMQFFAEQIKEFVGYQIFVVLTDSMEPTIPTGSIVLGKNVEDGQEIPEDTIISFHVDRLGNEAVFTHYFRKKEIDETGRERYYTQAENVDRYDDYVTYREDIISTYVTHVPYVGKFVLFLQSPFALLELGIILIIMVFYNILSNKFEEEEKAKLALQEEDKGQDLPDNEERFLIEAENIEIEDAQLPVGGETVREVLEVSDVIEEPPQEEAQPAIPVPEQPPEEAGGEEETVTVAGNDPGAAGEEMPLEQESAKPARNIFSYRMNRPDIDGKQSAAGFSVEIFRDGTIWHKIYMEDGQEQEVLTYTVDKKAVKRIRKLIKDSSSDIRKLPKELDNNASEGNFGTFSFMGKEIAGRNIQAHDLKKEKKNNIYYYKKYKRNMKHENEVMYLFKQIAKILKEEGIKLKLSEVSAKKEGKK